jgi:predicted nucleic acid-binding protein
MKLDLDSNIAVKWELSEELSAEADALRQDILSGLHEAIAPDVFPVEIAHALTRAERQGRQNPSQIRLLLADALATPVVLQSSLSLLERATDLAALARIGVYDCLYVALAEREGCQLVTSDQRLVNSLRATYSLIVNLSMLQ